MPFQAASPFVGVFLLHGCHQMAKRRKSRPVAAARAPEPVAPEPALPPASRQRRLALDLLALGAIVAVVVLGFLSRNALSPDGVSYLDLAAALRQLDFGHFVQGYWSPIYPFILGVIGGLGQLDNPGMTVLAHAVNTVCAVIGILILWWWARRHGEPTFGYLAIGAYLLVSAGMPRIEAVTPDVLLLTLAVALAYAWIVDRNRHPIVTGLLFGTMYLAKTSSWPWLFVTIPLVIWSAMPGEARQRVVRAAGVAAGTMLVWMIAMSIRYRQPTIGTAGSLNYSWYIEANSSRLPDVDEGANRAYQQLTLPNVGPLTMAVFDQWPTWTYQPWGDPTAWKANVETETGQAPSFDEITAYWLRQFGRAFGLWLLPALAATLPIGFMLRYRKGIWRELTGERRPELMLAAAGVIGVMQFVAVHTEPRLIAPFGMLIILGGLTWCFAGRANVAVIRLARVRLAMPWIVVLAAAGFAIPKFIDGVQSNHRLVISVGELKLIKSDAERTGMPLQRIAIIGPAAPALGSAYWIGAHIVAQITPASVPHFDSLSAPLQRDLVERLFGGHLAMVWKTTADGGLQMLVVPPPTQTTR